MGTMWRSEEMVYVSLIMTEEASLSCIRELGTLGCLQFVDLNPELTPFQREYVGSIKRCDEIERKIRYVSQEVKRLGIDVPTTSSIEDFIINARRESADGNGGGSGAYILESLEGNLDGFEGQLRGLVEYNTQLSEQYTKKVEYHHLLVQAHHIIRAVSEIELREGHAAKSGIMGVTADTSDDVENPLLGSGGGVSSSSIGAGTSLSGYQDGASEQQVEDFGMSFNNISGVINTSERNRFERMLFRVTRGNCYVRFAPLSAAAAVAMDADGQTIEKLCFVIFYKSATIESKIIRICDAFNATRYDLSMLKQIHALEAVRRNNYQELLDSKAVLDKNTAMRHSLCSEVANKIEEWFWVVRREKSMYHTLNLFKADVAGRLVRGRGWITQASVADAKQALHRAHMLLNLPQNSLIERVSGKWPCPPTHFVTNKYTFAFQEFVNTYGMPRYREINPALFTVATFPFIFGMMYGDLGHGTILTLGSIYLLMTSDKAKGRGVDDMVKNLYQARFMLFGMGCCAMYAGLLYNDFFSLGLDLFGTRYTFGKPEEKIEKGDTAVLKEGLKYGDPDSVYPFGVDPMWKLSTNSLPFFNSMKMKLSVIVGISQMTVGIFMKGINSWYIGGFGLDFFGEFLPMIVFDFAFFGYMIILIFTKWGINWDERMAMGSCQYDAKGTFGACHISSSPSGSCFTIAGDRCDANTQLPDMCPLDYGGTGDGCQPPNLITTLINIVLKPGTVDEPMFPGQAGVQVMVILVAFLCIPWLLCLKPYVLNRQHKAEMLASGGGHIGHAGQDHTDSLIGNVSDHDIGYDGTTTNPMMGYQEDEADALSIEMREFAASNGYNIDLDVAEDRTRAYSMESEDGLAATNGDMSSFLPGGGGYDGGDNHGHGDEFDFGEICVHQGIETIEYVLGMVSNTASYLRLWALSLAHTELAEVFWEKILLPAIESNNPVAIFIAFTIFAFATTGVLLFMDLLECFLHALRLHWVEFQSKFYKGDGQRFVPFDFKQVLSQASLE